MYIFLFFYCLRLLQFVGWRNLIIPFKRGEGFFFLNLQQARTYGVISKGLSFRGPAHIPEHAQLTPWSRQLNSLNN